jgi:dihydroorotase
MQVLLKKVTIIAPESKYHLKKKDILINKGLIEKIADSITTKSDITIDQKNTMVSIGWFDLFADFCDPGYEQKETLESGIASAASGGYTDVCLVPNTNPVTASKAQVEYIRNKSSIVNLHPIGAISKNLEGKDLSEMYDMTLSGAVAFSDGKKPVQHSGLLMKAMQYVKTFNGVIIEIPEDTSISKVGLMHEGPVSTQLGIQGKPAIAETIHLNRDIELLQYTDSHLHVTGISTKKSVDMIRQAKKQGLNISCSVTPYHLLYTDQSLSTYNSMYKVNPPLRTEEDRKALLKGVEDGTIDCIASHHFPQDWDAKTVEFEYAKNGMITLQTMLPMLLQASDKISMERWISMLTDHPRRIVNQSQPKLAEGEIACLTLFNPSATWEYNAASNNSLSANSPLWNQTLQGKILGILNNKQVHINE